ncbi:MAG: endolytic transglycosylase MltG [Treponemataceae bacterium]|nr:endolytic transglycosylase MltG [Treponemataceae bacterium]
MKHLTLKNILCTLFLLMTLCICTSCTVLDGPAAGTEYTLTVKAGANARSVGEELESAGIVKNASVFYGWARYKKAAIKTGIYRVNDSMGVEEILALLESGRQEHISVSIPEGYTGRQIAALLEERGVTSREDFMNSFTDEKLLGELKVPSTSFEGYLFPETYYFDPGMSGESVIRLMVKTFFSKIRESVPELLEKSPEDLNYIVRFASVVEKEYKLEEEAPLIASVFANRLRINMGLYSCATVMYIITDIQGKPHPSGLTIADTRIESPYNTYIHAGLPPTAISNPGLVALKAAANPPQTKYWYFQVVDEAAGRHVFEKDLDEHAYNLKTIKR